MYPEISTLDLVRLSRKSYAKLVCPSIVDARQGFTKLWQYWLLQERLDQLQHEADDAEKQYSTTLLAINTKHEAELKQLDNRIQEKDQEIAYDEVFVLL